MTNTAIHVSIIFFVVIMQLDNLFVCYIVTDCCPLPSFILFLTTTWTTWDNLNRI